MDPRIAELVVLTARADRLGNELHDADALVGELIMTASDHLAEAGRILAEMGLDELTACSGCGLTVEDGECESGGFCAAMNDGLEDL